MENAMRYVKTETVAAVQINLELPDGVLMYEKWGGLQVASQGDWLIDNNGEVYTCEAKVFASTYEMVSKGQYRKTATVEAEQTTEDGTVETLEGKSGYKAGDYIVTNPGGDRYPVEKVKFEAMYQPVRKDCFCNMDYPCSSDCDCECHS
jgi:hypothetical protein